MTSLPVHHFINHWFMTSLPTYLYFQGHFDISSNYFYLDLMKTGHILMQTAASHVPQAHEVQNVGSA
jgi:hypothetical protein